MSTSLSPSAEKYIKKLAALNPFDAFECINLDAVADEFIECAYPGVAYLDEKRKRRHFVTVRHSEFGKSFYGKNNKYFCELWIEFNFPVWIGVFIRVFEKVIVLVDVLFRKTSKTKFLV